MADRYYLPDEYPEGRPVYLTDLGATLRVAGIILQGMGATAVLLTPSGDNFDITKVKFAQPTLDEWGEIIRASDDPQVFVADASGTTKILARKLRFEISGFTQQKVWHRDGFKCVCCQKGIPEVQLSVDHWQPLSVIGEAAHRESNYVSMCRRCNKQKGDMPAKQFCEKYGHDYDRIQKYMEGLL